MSARRLTRGALCGLMPVAAVGLALSAIVRCSRSPAARDNQIRELQASYQTLRDSVAFLASADPVVSAAASNDSDILLGLRRPALQELLEELARRYPGRIALQTEAPIRLERNGRLALPVPWTAADAGT